jgi:nucleotide-binding universal stress UspA family protein
MAISIRRVLFPYDFSPQCRNVVPFVRALAAKTGARVTLLSVVPPSFAVPVLAGAVAIPATDDPAATGRALRMRLEQEVSGTFDPIPTVCATADGDPALQIAKYAAEYEVDLVMMPTHGVGLFRAMVIGSATSRVLHDAACPVWTAAHADEQRADPNPRTVLCATDSGPAAVALVRWAAAFAAAVGADLKIVHVVPPITDWPSLPSEERLQQRVRSAAEEAVHAMLRSAGVEAPLHVPVLSIVQGVIEEAHEQRADVVIVGRGSVAEPFGRLRTHAFGIIQRSPCPVISV